MLVGSIEAGDAKFVCTVGNVDHQVKDQDRLPTTKLAETLKNTAGYLKRLC